MLIFIELFDTLP